jgi:DNA-binding CsgD family transcriptional regulator
MGWRRTTQSEPFGHSEVALLDALRPHLGRATFIAARLRSAAARAAAATLAALALPRFVLDDLGRIVEANALIDEVAALIIYGARNRFAFRDLAANEQFRTAVGTIADDGARTPRSFVVRDEAGAPARVAHVVPIRLAALDIFSRSSAALIFTAVAEPGVPPVEILRSLFDLTAKEADVARALAGGAGIDAIAAAERISRNTVRAHLRVLMAKAGCRRQAELVALFAGLRAPG